MDKFEKILLTAIIISSMFPFVFPETRVYQYSWGCSESILPDLKKFIYPLAPLVALGVYEIWKPKKD